MREITHAKRIKKIYKISDEEFRSGEWCKDENIIPKSELLNVDYKAKSGILIVHDAQIKSLESLKSRQTKKMEEKENGDESE